MIAVRAINLSKNYQIAHAQARNGHHGRRYRTLREDLIALPRAILGRNGSATEVFHALRDVSFEVSQGEVVGIVGRNGAGKSTLLKILSRITEPSSGRAEIYGRVGSLLEVGTGFHPELTGRENVFLNGAILGMRREEIARQFDQIVAFAEVEQFLDTPVKRYSSGMYTRLAFSVAAHLDPEILIVDEVLAVGDAAFQRKCLGKMSEVASGGRTVLFVSHNMAAVRALCGRCIYLRHGSIATQGLTDDVLRIYQQDLQRVEIDATTAVHDEKMRRGNGAVRFNGIQITDDSGKKISQCHPGQAVRFEMEYRVMRDVPRMDVFVGLRSGKSGEFVTSARHEVAGADLRADHSGTIVLELPAITLRPGEYLLYFWLGASSSEPFDVVDDLTAPLTVVPEKHQSVIFDHSENIGFFDVQSRLVQTEKIAPPNEEYLM